MKTETPVIFTKGNGWEQLEGCLLDRMDEILKECEENEDSFVRLRPFPKTGVFIGMYDTIESNKEIFIAACDYAREVAGGKKRLPKFTLTQAKYNPEKLLKHLNTIMALRRLVIKFLKSDKAPTLHTEDGRSVKCFDEE